MGFITDLFGGNSAASDAAGVQAESGEAAIGQVVESGERARQDLSPFVQTGSRGLGMLGDLVTNPNRQRDFIENNPFFNSLAGRAKDDLFNNQAARGKVGSGGTAEALQNSMMLLGERLLGGRINQLQNLTGLGANAAAGQANTAVRTGGQVADLTTGIGNAQAAGIVGDQRSRSQGASNFLNAAATAGSLFLSDVRAKTDIEPLGKTNAGIGIYKYRYKGDREPRIGVMAQEVEQHDPGAVHTIAGLKHVDIARVR